MVGLLLLPKSKELLKCTPSSRAASKPPQTRQFLLISPIPLLGDDPDQHFQFLTRSKVLKTPRWSFLMLPRFSQISQAAFHSTQTSSTCQRRNPQLKSSLIRSREASSESSSKQGKKNSPTIQSNYNALGRSTHSEAEAKLFSPPLTAGTLTQL